MEEPDTYTAGGRVSGMTLAVTALAAVLAFAGVVFVAAGWGVARNYVPFVSGASPETGLSHLVAGVGLMQLSVGVMSFRIGAILRRQGPDAWPVEDGSTSAHGRRDLDLMSSWGLGRIGATS